MNKILLLTVLGVFCGIASAQVIPATPKKFGKRTTGGATAGGIGILPGNSATTGAKPTPPPPPTIRQVVYIVLGEPRQWTSSDGRTLVGKIIAFEESVAQSSGTAPAVPTPEQMAKSLSGPPTVVREGKVRLLVNNKPFEVALSTLSSADQEYVAALQGRIKPPTAVQPVKPGQ